jgi:putative photosynthetic complex assembly protein 2
MSSAGVDAVSVPPVGVTPVPVVPLTGWRQRLHVLLRARHPDMVQVTDIATRETTIRVALRSFAVVVLFWWSTTGLVFALERSPATRLLGFVVASALALWGASLVYLERDRDTPSAVRRSFLGGAFLWTWAQVAFYGAWIIGPESMRLHMPAEPPSWDLAVRAVLSMFWYQLVMLAVLAVTAFITHRRTNRTGWWTIALFWCVHQVASINIFLGVENSGRGFFPEALVFLESYFGPAVNSWFLPFTIACVIAYTLYTALYAIRGRTPAYRQSMMLLTVIGALSVLELAVLGAPIQLPLWEAFLTVRGY